VSSREVFLYLPLDKKEIMNNETFRVLKPNGNLIIVDWIKENNFSQNTLKMIEIDSANFNLITIEEYLECLKRSGFKDIFVYNLTENYIKYSDQKTFKCNELREEYINRFGQKVFDNALLSWDYQKKAFLNHEIRVVKIIANKSE